MAEIELLPSRQKNTYFPPFGIWLFLPQLKIYLMKILPNGEVRLWQVADAQPFLTLKGHTDLVWSVAWSPDGKILVSGSSDRNPQSARSN